MSVLISLSTCILARQGINTNAGNSVFHMQSAIAKFIMLSSLLIAKDMHINMHALYGVFVVAA